MKHSPSARLALYTTIYPGVAPYLPAWYRSVLEQADQDFELWVGLDAMGIEAAKSAIGCDLEATWVMGLYGDTPAQIRQRALAQIVQSYDAVVLVDSDDVLHASRVATARKSLCTSDLVGCALRLVDERGRDLGMTFKLPSQVDLEGVLPRNNIFGMSNSAIRSDVLRRCLPIPDAVELVDWLVATRAWLLGAALAFDNEVRMDYRQHDANMTRIAAPFDKLQVARETDLVRRHFRILQATSPQGAMAHRLAEVARVAADIEVFHRCVVLQTKRLELYLRALNALEIAPLWWSSVAHPVLRDLWDSHEEMT